MALTLDTPITIDGVETTPGEWMKQNASEQELMSNWAILEEDGDDACDEHFLNLFHDTIANKNIVYTLIGDDE